MTSSSKSKSSSKAATIIPTSAATTTHKERWLTVAKLPELRPKVGLDPDCRPQKAWIRLHGLWLREAGFLPQARVRVRVMPGCLVITAE